MRNLLKLFIITIWIGTQGCAHVNELGIFGNTNQMIKPDYKKVIDFRKAYGSVVVEHWYKNCLSSNFHNSFMLELVKIVVAQLPYYNPAFIAHIVSKVNIEKAYQLHTITRQPFTKLLPDPFKVKCF